MSTKMSRVLIYSIGVCFLAACGPMDVDVHGEVFIVTEGSQNVKLGLVQIDVIPEKTMIPFIAEKIRNARVEVEKLRPIQEKLKNEYDTAKYKFEKAEFFLDLTNAVHRVEPPSRENLKESDEALKEYNEKKDRLENKRDKYMKVLSQYLSFSKGSYFVTEIPDAIQTAKTNAEGAFILRLRESKYALVAHATRKVAESTEEYYWLVWLSVTQSMPNRILLSNDNLLETNRKDCVVKLSEIPY